MEQQLLLLKKQWIKRLSLMKTLNFIEKVDFKQSLLKCFIKQFKLNMKEIDKLLFLRDFQQCNFFLNSKNINKLVDLLHTN